LALQQQEKSPGSFVLKDDRRDGGLIEKIIGDIDLPEFYHDISELEGIELIQGSHFIDRPHYDKKEQIMCAIDGQLDIVLVPHINRQEVYAGESLLESPYDNSQSGGESGFDQMSVSPVNFFMPKKKIYPHFQGATRELINLEKGDCIFVPAFYFHQYQAFHLAQNQHKQY